MYRRDTPQSGCKFKTLSYNPVMASPYYTELLQQDTQTFCTSLQVLLSVYKSFNRPHLDYASVVWSPNLNGEVESLENVQTFALQVCLKSCSSIALCKVVNVAHVHKWLTSFGSSACTVTSPMQ